MGTNYYAVRSRPTICDPIHIGKSSAGWMFLFHEQEDAWCDPPIYWHSFNDVKDWLEQYVYKEHQFVIMNEYDEEIDYEEFFDMIENKQQLDKRNPQNFEYCKNVNGYRFSDSDFC